MPELHRYNCGCIGFAADENGNAIIVDVCDDSDGTPHTFTWRDMSGKDSEVLSPEEANEIFMEIDFLIAQGYRLREIRFLMGIKTETL
jgi:hypothetical protein